MTKKVHGANKGRIGDPVNYINLHYTGEHFIGRPTRSDRIATLSFLRNCANTNNPYSLT